ncbi:hypothetical protein LAV79_02100 [Peribacillus butanolivorans]|uniref:hypothetical protein n=1 Tax=Peribacillus butanolivorans TaxID=421767 RepID=UPI0030C9A841
MKFDHRFNGGAITFSSPTYTSQTSKTAVMFKSMSEGIFEVTGQVIVKSSTYATVSILPRLYQVKSPDFSLTKTSEDEFNATLIKMKSGQELTILI